MAFKSCFRAALFLYAQGLDGKVGLQTQSGFLFRHHEHSADTGNRIFADGGKNTTPLRFRRGRFSVPSSTAEVMMDSYRGCEDISNEKKRKKRRSLLSCCRRYYASGIFRSAKLFLIVYIFPWVRILSLT